MNDYKAVRSSLDISKSIAFYLEMSDPAAFRLRDRAGSIRTINDILQGRSEQTVETMLAELEQKGGTYYAGEIAVLRQNIQDFQRQKMMLTQPYSKSSGKTYRFRAYNGGNGRSLKIVDQKLFDRAAKAGFPPGFFRETYLLPAGACGFLRLHIPKLCLRCLPDQRPILYRSQHLQLRISFLRAGTC